MALATDRQQDLFVAGQAGYDTYRIPALIAGASGVLLAFCEARRHSSSDTGDIDLVMRRSTDGGATWSPIRVIADDGPHTVGNPCPVIDRATGTVHLLLTHNLGHDTEAQIVDQTSTGTRRALIMSSVDDGASWSDLVDLTPDVKQADWTWYATGPGVGIQTRAGRLVVPCDHIEAESRTFWSHVIVSDDGGRTWRLGGRVGPGINECQVAELADGRLLLNSRNHHRPVAHRRAVSWSSDGGETWSPAQTDAALVEPVCQASLVSRTCERGGCLLFSNPAATVRERLTVRASWDDGASWPESLVLHEGPSAYSCLCWLPSGAVACLYERGQAQPYERLTLARFALEDLTA